MSDVPDTKTKKIWTVQETCKLIELYRENPGLWDTKCTDYKNRYKKADLLIDIAKVMSTSSEEIERKLKNINSQFLREKRLHEKLKKSGAGREFHSKWFGFNLMSFLRDKNIPRKTIEAGLEETDLDYEESSSPLEHNEDTDDDIISTKPNETLLLKINPELKINTLNKSDMKASSTARSKITTHEQRSAEVFNLLKEMQEDKKIKRQNQEIQKRQLDEFDSFGELIAKQMRSLKTNHSQTTVQYLINNIMYDAKLGKYDYPQSSVSYSVPYTTSTQDIQTCENQSELNALVAQDNTNCNVPSFLNL